MSESVRRSFRAGTSHDELTSLCQTPHLAGMWPTVASCEADARLGASSTVKQPAIVNREHGYVCRYRDVTGHRVSAVLMIVLHLPPPTRLFNVVVVVCLSVCLSVSNFAQKLPNGFA